MMSVSDEMFDELEQERKARRLETVQEVTRQIVSDYLRQKGSPVKSAFKTGDFLNAQG